MNNIEELRAVVHDRTGRFDGYELKLETLRELFRRLDEYKLRCFWWFCLGMAVMGLIHAIMEKVL